MRLHSLELKHINQFSSVKVDFGSASAKIPFTLILGEQNSGKSNLLKQIFHGLSWFAGRHKDLRGAGIIIADSDIRSSAVQASIGITIAYPPELGHLYDDQHATPKTSYLCTWQVKKIKTANASIGLSRADTADLELLIPRYHKQLESDPQFSTPCIAYYPVERFVHEVNLQIKNTGSTLFPLHNAYDIVSVSFTTFSKFFEWLREIHDQENAQSAQMLKQYLNPNTRFQTQEQLDELFTQIEHAYRLAPQRCLNSLRTALQTVLPEIQDIYIEFQPRLRLMVNYQGQDVPFLQLSQTDKTWFALVGDVVRRLCILNPKSLYPCLEGEGVILIDEVDLQLDQSHRQQILRRLHQAFPRLQFIVTGLSSDLVDQHPEIECYQLQQQQLEKLNLFEHQQKLQQIYQDIELAHQNEELPLEYQAAEVNMPEMDFNQVVEWAKGLNTQERTQLFNGLLGLPQRDDQV